LASVLIQQIAVTQKVTQPIFEFFGEPKADLEMDFASARYLCTIRGSQTSVARPLGLVAYGSSGFSVLRRCMAYENAPAFGTH